MAVEDESGSWYPSKWDTKIGFVSYFCKRFFKTVFINIKHTKYMFSENSFLFFTFSVLVFIFIFFIFFLCFSKKKKNPTGNYI